MSTTSRDTTWAKQLLRESGLRATAARIAVLKQLAESKTPHSHADVVEELQGSGFDQSTLFRSLNEMADSKLLIRLDLGDQIRRFEIRQTDNSDSPEHPHFMCIDCGKLLCLNDFRVTISPNTGSIRERLGQITEVLLRGHCGQCSIG